MMFPLRFFIEVIVAFLGGMILWLALEAHRIPDRHSASWIAVSAALLAWGVLTFIRARGLHTYWVDRVGGITLVAVGALMFAMRGVAFQYVMPMFAAVGGLLVLRGVVGVLLVSRNLVSRKA